MLNSSDCQIAADSSMLQDADGALVAEANHRVANSLFTVSALIRAAGARLGNDAELITAGRARAVLATASGRIDAIARLHKQLTAPGGARYLDAGSYLDGLGRDLVHALSEPGRFLFRSQTGHACALPPDRALKLGLIVSELIINAIKYSHPSGVTGNILLTVRPREGLLLVEVADDGVGMPDGAADGAGSTHGTGLVHSLCEQLGARIGYHSHDLGLRCTIEMPLTADD